MSKGIAPIKAEYLIKIRKKEKEAAVPAPDTSKGINGAEGAIKGAEEVIIHSESEQSENPSVETVPNETNPSENRYAERFPNEAKPSENGSAETVPNDTKPSENPSAETVHNDTKPSEPAGEKRKLDESEKPAHPKQNKRRKGQNKQREKFSNKRAAPGDRLCKSMICGTIACSYGDKCKFSHNVNDYMAKKPADIGEVCYIFQEHGRCPYGITCRYGQSHIIQVDGGYKSVIDEKKVSSSKTVNGMDMDVKMKLTRRKYNFAGADKSFKEAQKFVSKIVKQNVELNCSKKVKPLTAAQRDSLGSVMYGAADDQADADVSQLSETTNGNGVVNKTDENVNIGTGTTDLIEKAVTEDGKQKEIDTEPLNPGEITTKSEDVSPNKPIGPVTNEDQFTIKPAEKKTVDFRNKLYLAPLTTVGNLPFRRVCKSYGVDITCGEMALATKLLQGVNSEWALMKRHSSEDLFGVQVAGAFPDTMAKCAQLLSETCDIDFIDINVGCPIDLIFDMGAGTALMRRVNRLHEIVRSMVTVSTVPITIKIRKGVSESKSTAHTLIPKIKMWDVGLCTLHGRSREQRYTKKADWDYIDECAKIADPMPFFGGGDILSYEDYNAAMKTNVSGVMIARGALIKPWVFTEIKEQRHWDISSSERLDILRDYANYGLEHWGSDLQGVETTRRFMLEWLSFLHRYIPVGLLERLPQQINERPSPYYGRDDLETLMASPMSADWVKISEMLLGPVPDGFFFIPKHRASSYTQS